MSDIQNISQEFQLPKAAQACVTCRKQKRKCDKRLPSCSLCQRMSRNCDYSEPRPSPTAEDYEQLRRKVFDLEDRLSSNSGVASINNGYGAVDPYLNAPQSNLANPDHEFSVPVSFEAPYLEPVTRFPAIALLDSEAFKYGRVQVPTPSIHIPREVSDILGDCHSVEEVIVEYFATIHTWFPFISKTRMNLDIINMITEAGPDLALLFLSMKLIVTRPHQEGQVESVQIPIYYVTKRFLALIETSGMASLNVLQSYILIAIYELGHAIYPAAWMTIGACARYGSLLGINGHKEVAVLLGQPGTRNELEERRRTWYAVSILDKCVTIGSLGHSLAMKDFQAEDVLPLNDEAWDNSISDSPIPTNFATSLTEPTVPFARLCQASNLLGKTIHHLQDPSSDLQVDRFEATSQFQQIINELTEALISEANQPSQDYMSLATPLAISLSALSLISSHYTSPSHHSGHPTSNQEPATQSLPAPLTTATTTIKNLATTLLTHTTDPSQDANINLNLNKTSPLITHTLYTAASHYAWLIRSHGTNNSIVQNSDSINNSNLLEEYQAALDSIRFCLRRVGERWRCAAEYLRILEAQEFTYAISSA